EPTLPHPALPAGDGRRGACAIQPGLGLPAIAGGLGSVLGTQVHPDIRLLPRPARRWQRGVRPVHRGGIAVQAESRQPRRAGVDRRPSDPLVSLRNRRPAESAGARDADRTAGRPRGPYVGAGPVRAATGRGALTGRAAAFPHGAAQQQL
ncbi:MAG: hypothetical protein AVDCRST_MAG71-2217, partial [uncultured Lysobacter sp.]